MSAVDNVKTLKAEVEILLAEKPILRDSVRKLWSRIIFNRISEERLRSLSALDFLKLYTTSELPTEETVGRASRKAQEDNINLRGQFYKERKDQAEEFRTEINV